MKPIPNFFTLTQAAAILDMSRSGAKKAAKREGWTPYQAGNAHLYRGCDVYEYRDHRTRTELVRSLGWCGPNRHLYRCDDIDIECPECGAFAVMWPPPPELADKWRCVEGHGGSVDPISPNIDPDTGEPYRESGENKGAR